MITAFSCLSVRPITLLSQSDLETWGVDHIKTLCAHFGKTLVHAGKESLPVVNSSECLAEWAKVKKLVVTNHYPRHSTSALWSLIREFHPNDFPNLLTLASICLVLPTHTSDCERSLSAQNLLKSARRNRIGEKKLQACMLLLCPPEGGHIVLL